MAAPAKSAEPTRDAQIKIKEAAIKKRLQANSAKAASKAKTGKKYNVGYIKGAGEGFTASDYGVGLGAAIPYQVGKFSYTKKKKNNPTTAPSGIRNSKMPSWGKVVNKSPAASFDRDPNDSRYNRDVSRTYAIQRRLSNLG